MAKQLSRDGRHKQTLQFATAVDGFPASSVRPAGKKTARAAAEKMRVVGYCRVSTMRQVQEGVSIDAQRARIAAYCEIRGFSLVEVITDEGCSAASLKRPGLQAALRLLSTGKADALMVCAGQRTVQAG